MAIWSDITLRVIGQKKGVRAFDRVALKLPVLSEIHESVEGMDVYNLHRWGRHGWESCYCFSARSPKPTVDMLRELSQGYADLCFQVDSMYGCEQLDSYFVRRGRVAYRHHSAYEKRLALFREMSGGVDYYSMSEDDEEAIEREIDGIVGPEFEELCERFWHRRVYRVLYEQRRHK